MQKMSVIVVAAGSGQRFGGQENKVFAKIGDQPVFLRALQLFVNREDVAETILVVAPGDMETMKSKFGPNLGFMGVKLVAGGARRADSVANGLAAVAADAELVAVHDAVRVCVAHAWIDAVREAAEQSGAAVPVVPVTATIKRLGPDKTIAETVSRERLFMAQTPQVFRADVLRAAYEARTSEGDDEEYTDDAQLVSAAGHAVTAVDGDPRNIKITAPGDLQLAGAILKSLPQKPTTRMGAFDEAQW